MSLDFHQFNLPVAEVVPEVRAHLAKESTIILKAPPGAGKSTLVPLTLLEEEWLEGRKIFLLEPRRLAAKSIAQRMADMLGEKVGETVGYRVRFDVKVSERTRIEILTEGILTRMLQDDNALEDVGIVIFDEFHERSLHADLAMALCRECQQVLRDDLKVMVMSATLDMPQLSALLDNCPIVESEGRMFPVEKFYVGDTDRYLLPELMTKTIQNALKDHDGDILCFMPGQGEIMKCADLLHQHTKGIAIYPLFGQLPINKQRAAILPHPEEKRKVVLATSIAETSLTIEGVKIVIDSGFTRIQQFDPNSGLSRLETVMVSEDAADQRAGRAGRLGPGICYRMWSKTTHSRLEETREPEIEQADLTSLVLDLAQWGIIHPNELAWVTPPPAGHVAQAKDTLTQLEALEDEKITPHGKAIHRLPCHPRIAHMLLFAEENELLPLATDLAAIIEERDPLPKNSGADINTRITALRRSREGGKNPRFRQINKISEVYRKLFKSKEDNHSFDDFETGLLLAHAYPERIACAKPGNNAQFQLANGKIAAIGHRDDLADEAWLAVAHIDARDGMGKIFMASPLDPTDLAPMVREKEVVKWDTDEGGLIANKQLCIGNIILKSTPINNPDPSHLQQAILDAIKKEGKQLLPFKEKEVEQWQSRVLSLKKWNPKDKWPDVSTETLLYSASKWLSPYLDKIKKPADLMKLELQDILHHSLPWELQEQLDTLAPTKIKVPSGSNIKLKYLDNGQPPVLAVRLQECFGLEDTPMINNGKQSVVLHLLSPGFKPVQITSDLKSFWNNAYFEVKKDLKRRYPKHSWPDDPWTEEAVRGVKRKKS
ncbi:ATP-dependent helicase HrpB [Flammeovirga aprica]|uniref:ATP-dependent helicase HrpB n=1 Tax=Flammeovirga aprica JL-4 TaxID=694437 RepID=A0A7X9S0X1_9BACT|nr:ATP-dependent helicase HrpB [Flammeovirga aprica]NME72127.1 ATP-dependent helicase HrpB [Flammeovirga aprica JL-4]